MSPRRPSALFRACFAAFTVASSAGAFVSAHQRTALNDVLERAGRYVSTYETRASALVAEEDYLQELKSDARDSLRSQESDMVAGWSSIALPPPGTQSIVPTREKQTGPTRRRMRSDVLMVQLPDRTWFGFRDVIEVDGTRVRDREGRLQELFLKSQSTKKRILDESARYNIGPVIRNTNVPTFALLFLLPDVQNRFAFDKVGEEEIDGAPVWVVSFAEIAEPTIVKDARDRDVPASGRFWIVAATGEVLKTEMIAGTRTTLARGRTTVDYRFDETLAMLVPASMREVYDQPPRPLDPYVNCTATYSNFRRFQVTTDTKVAIPK